MRSLLLLIAIAFGVAFAAPDALAQPPENPSASQWLAAFSKGWDDTKWEKSFRTAPNPYMRPIGDDGWKVRMNALQGVVVRGNDSIPTLLAALKSDDVVRRVFAAQALGYLAPEVPTEPLLLSAKNDPDPAVRMYAVDALGMKGDAGIDFDALLKSERGRDVLKHVNYAKERKGERVAAAVVNLLKGWNAKSIDSAIVGKAAPEFTLTAATGEVVKLSSFKGKSAVVLVFIYGDT